MPSMLHKIKNNVGVPHNTIEPNQGKTIKKKIYQKQMRSEQAMKINHMHMNVKTKEKIHILNKHKN